MQTPALPKPDGYVAMGSNGSIIVPPQDFAKHNAYAVFTADQMRAYAQQHASGMYDEVMDTLRHHRMRYWQDEEGGNMMLVDALTPDVDTDIARGIEEIEHICDAIYNNVLSHG